MWSHKTSTFLIIKNVFLISSCCKKEEVISMLSSYFQFIFLLSTSFPIFELLSYFWYAMSFVKFSCWYLPDILSYSNCLPVIRLYSTGSQGPAVGASGMECPVIIIFLLLFQNHISIIFQLIFKDNTNTILLL